MLLGDQPGLSKADFPSSETTAARYRASAFTEYNFIRPRMPMTNTISRVEVGMSYVEDLRAKSKRT